MRAKVRLVVQVLCISLLQVAGRVGRTAQAQGHDAAAPKVSRFAPADDLARQAEYYVKELENSVASKDEYKDDQEKLTKDASTLAVIALALGMHDQPNKYKARAGVLIKAAQAAAATKDYESAQEGRRRRARGRQRCQRGPGGPEMGAGRGPIGVDEAGADHRHEIEAAGASREVQDEGEGNGRLYGGDRRDRPGLDRRPVGRAKRQPRSSNGRTSPPPCATAPAR